MGGRLFHPAFPYFWLGIGDVSIYFGELTSYSVYDSRFGQRESDIFRWGFRSSGW